MCDFSYLVNFFLKKSFFFVKIHSFGMKKMVFFENFYFDNIIYKEGKFCHINTIFWIKGMESMW